VVSAAGKTCIHVPVAHLYRSCMHRPMSLNQLNSVNMELGRQSEGVSYSHQDFVADWLAFVAALTSSDTLS